MSELAAKLTNAGAVCSRETLSKTLTKIQKGDINSHVATKLAGLCRCSKADLPQLVGAVAK